MVPFDGKATVKNPPFFTSSLASGAAPPGAKSMTCETDGEKLMKKCGFSNVGFQWDHRNSLSNGMGYG